MNDQLIVDYIDQREEEYIELFREILRSNSYNPPGNEMNVAKVLDSYLLKANIKTELIDLGNNRANFLAFLNDNFKNKILLYNGHMDVVPAGDESEWKNSPLDAYIKRNKLIYGRGAADMKGGLVAMVIALKVLKELNLEVKGNLIFNAVADEETGGELGTKWMIENRLRTMKLDFAVIGEPTGLNPLPKAIILGEKGHLLIKIITHGISCHASMPAMGKNAIYMMNEIIQKLDSINNYIPDAIPPLSMDRLKDLVSVSFPSREVFEKILVEQPLLQNVISSLVEFTKAMTIINAGIKENVIPDRCEAIIDFRLLPGQQVGPVIEGLKKLVETELGFPIKEKSTINEPSVSIEVFSASEGSYWNDWEKSEDLKTFHGIIDNVYKKKPFYILYPASADANFLRNNGFCPNTILFGPGSAGTAHAIDEYIEIKDFINSIKVFAIFAWKFLS